MSCLSLTLSFLVCTGGTSSSAPPAPVAKTEVAVERAAQPDLDEILAALRAVETGGSKSGGRHATGDGGSAIGPYQIHLNYWKDARIAGRFEDCRDPAYARSVVLAYWKRYAPKALAALDAEVLARVHNGGPDGHKETCTLAFWRKVQRELELRREKRAAEARSTPPAPTEPAPSEAKPRRKLPARPELV